MRQKSDIQFIFPIFKAIIKNLIGTKIVSLFTNNGVEYIGLTSYLNQNGINHLTSPPHTHEHNGILERKHRHIVETGLTLLHDSNMSNEFKSYAFQTAVYLINRMTTPLLKNKSPFEIMFKQRPNYLKLRIFGCLCYLWTKPFSTRKL